jgi:hypothetical protein
VFKRLLFCLGFLGIRVSNTPFEKIFSGFVEISTCLFRKRLNFPLATALLDDINGIQGNLMRN